MGTTVKDIPHSLIYEMEDGVPVYYQGYQEYLKGEKPIEDIMGSSLLQSAIIGKILLLMHAKFGDRFLYLTNEVGIQLSKNSWRAADVAVIDRKRLKGKKLSNEYQKYNKRNMTD